MPHPKRYKWPMAELLDRAMQSVRPLPAATQDALARILLELAGDDKSPVTLSAVDEASFEASFREAERGEFASDDEIRAIWAKHGL
jgi:predicted transcriptional regulator